MTTELSYEVYNDKSFVVRGDRDKYGILLKKCHGRWNSRLKQGSGWIVSKEYEQELKNIIESINNSKNNIPEKPKDDSFKSISSDENQVEPEKIKDNSFKSLSSNEIEEQIEKKIYKNLHREISASKFMTLNSEDEEDNIIEKDNDSEEEQDKYIPSEEKIIKIIRSEQIKNFEREKEEFENNRKGENKRKEDGRKDKHKEEKHKEHKHKEEKHKEDGRKDKHKEDGRKDKHKEERHKEHKYKEDGRKDKHKEPKHKEERHKEHKHKEERHKEDGRKDNHKEPKHSQRKYVNEMDDEQKMKYYKTFSKKPKDFKELYPSSDEELNLSCSESRSASSEEYLRPETPKRKNNVKKQENYDELFSKVKELQKKIGELELKNKRHKY